MQSNRHFHSAEKRPYGQRNMNFQDKPDDLKLTHYDTGTTRCSSFQSNDAGNSNNILASFCFPDLDTKAQFPEDNSFEIQVEQRGVQIALKAYHYPKPEGCKRRGVVFYFHGYCSNITREALIGQLLARHGHFDVFAIDQRGFGQSQGIARVIESEDDICNDQWLLINTVMQKYKIDQQETPLFLFGRSFGGLIATQISTSFIGQRMFKACALLCPFYQLHDPYFVNYVVPATKLVSMIAPYYEVKAPQSEHDQEYKEKWGHLLKDPEEISYTPRTVQILDDLQKKINQELQQDQTSGLPYYVALAEKDTVVSNQKIYENLQQRENSHLQEFSGVDHMNILHDPNTISTIVKNTIEFFNSKIQVQMEKQ